MTKEVMQQALEALENIDKAMPFPVGKQAITALRRALEQPEQEPVVCRFCHSKKGCWTWQCYDCGEIDDVQQPAAKPEPCIGKDPRCPCQDGDACHYEDCGGTKAWPVPQAAPVGEVVEVNNDGFRCEFSQRLAVGTKLYTFPPAAQPVQEPVAWGWRYDSCGHAVVDRLVATETSEPTLFLKDVFARGPFPLYAAPQPVQEPLDDWDIDAIRHNIGVDIDSLWARKFARAIEAAHGIKEKT